jgi:hypothetical protein
LKKSACPSGKFRKSARHFSPGKPENPKPKTRKTTGPGRPGNMSPEALSEAPEETQQKARYKYIKKFKNY